MRKLNTNGFDKNPSNINKSGANRKALTTLTRHIEKLYGKKPPRTEVLNLMEYIETLSVENLKKFVQDQKIPAIVQAYGRLILTGDNKDFKRVQGAEMLNDRLHGKPKQTIENEGNQQTSVFINRNIISANEFKPNIQSGTGEDFLAEQSEI